MLVDQDGVTYIYGRQASDLRKLDESEEAKIDCGNCYFSGQECLVIFDDVFVPNERAFMDGEFDFTSMIVEYFAAYHRQSYGGCKGGVGDVMIGAADAIASAGINPAEVRALATRFTNDSSSPYVTLESTPPSC